MQGTGKKGFRGEKVLPEGGSGAKGVSSSWMSFCGSLCFGHPKTGIQGQAGPEGAASTTLCWEHPEALRDAQFIP